MSLLTFGQFKSGPAKYIAGACPGSPEFADLTNQATRELLRRGNWFGSVQPMEGCVTDGCITWLRPVAAPLAINICNRPTELTNRWGQFLPWNPEHVATACNYYLHGRGGNLTAEMDGTTPVFNPIACNAGMYLQFFIDNASDVDKTITVFGIDSNGQVIRSQRADGTWQDGVQLVLAIPYVQTPMLVRHVTRVLKDITNGMVRGYQWDGVSMNGSNPLLLDLCSYQPSETSPDYLHSRLHGFRPNSHCAFNRITALVKLGFVPVVNDADLLLIENEDAVSHMIQSIRYKNSGDNARASSYEADAFRELNYQLRDRFPIEQLTTDFRPFGSASLSRVTGGFF